MKQMTEPKIWKQELMELKQEIHKYTIIVEDFNTFLSVTVRTTNWKIIKDMEELINTINQQYLINI